MNRKDFLNALNIVKPAVAVKPFINMLGCFMFKEGRVLAYNDVVAIETTLNAPFTGCLKGDLLHKMISNMFVEDIEFEIGQEDGKPELVIKGGRSRFVTTVFDTGEFTSIFTFPEYRQSSLVLPIDDSLALGFKLCLLSTASAPNHPSEMGLTVSISNTVVTIFSTDNKSMCRYVSNITSPQTGQFTLPTAFCHQFVDACNVLVGTKLYLTPGFVVAEIGSTRIFSKMIVNPEPLDFEEVITQATDNLPAQITIPLFLKASLERAMVIMNIQDGQDNQDGHRRTEFEIKNQQFTMYSKNKAGEVEDSAMLRGTYPDVKFITDPKLIDRVLDNCDAISFSPDIMFLKGVEGKFTHLISCYRI